MKEFFIKGAILFLAALFESVVGLPILLSGLFLFWVKFKSDYYQIGWIIWSGVLLGLLWNLSWWLSVLLMFLLALVFLSSQRIFKNKNLRILFLAIFFSLGLFLIGGFSFNFRILIYAVLSIVGLIIFQKLLSEKFEKKYL